MKKVKQRTKKQKEANEIAEAAKNMMGYFALASNSSGIMRLAEHVLALEVAIARSGVTAAQLGKAKSDVSKAVTQLFSTMVPPAQYGYAQ